MTQRDVQLLSGGTGPRWQAAQAARTAGAEALAGLLRATRARTQAWLAAYEAALGPQLRVPLSPQCNPPLWELGHIGWFQETWIGRNQQRTRGVACDPAHARHPSRLPQADALYDSSQVPHDSRWNLDLPDLAATQAYLQATLEDTLAALALSPEDDASLYFYRLVLFHEAMHGEAAVYMAQALGIALSDALSDDFFPAGAANHGRPGPVLDIDAGPWQLGWPGSGFAFDNECASHPVDLPACQIDSLPVNWEQFLPFVEHGGYAEAHFWSPAGWQWLQTQAAQCPRYLRRSHHEPGWECQYFGQWLPLDLNAPAVHLSAYEAEAWCRWAGRSLPDEAQWERAAMSRPDFHWGDVWEWTSSTFAAFPGFVAHPYRDYSQPWFGSRPVLRGASRATAAHLVHPRYRNYFTAERNDIFAGFRSCKMMTK